MRRMCRSWPLPLGLGVLSSTRGRASTFGTSAMRCYLSTSIAHVWGLVLVLLVGCSSLRPTGELRDEFLQNARLTLEQDGGALFGTSSPTIDDLRSGQNPELIRQLVRRLDGPYSVFAEMLLSALAVLEGKHLVPEFCAFDQVTNRLAIDDLNLIIMKATRTRSITIVIPETGDSVRYRLWRGDTGFGYSQEESRGDVGANSLYDEKADLLFRESSQKYWRERL
jgi:hypothetical protein